MEPISRGQSVRRYACQVLVIGSGVSGYCAAIQAGRLGCDTILIEKDEVLGGNSGPNLGVGITGADRYNAYGTETGLIHEIEEDAAWAQGFTQITRGTMPYNISRRFEATVQEHLERAGVRVLKRHYARAPVVGDDGRITGVVVEDLAAFRTVQIDARVVIEASGDGEIGALAGAEYDVGSEAQGEFGERSAPPERTPSVQGTSLVAIAQRTDREVVFIPPAGTPPFEPRLWHSRLGSYIHHHDGWFDDDLDLKFLYVTETGGHLDTIRDDGQIYEMLLRQLWAEWDHIKNGPHKEEARCWDLLWVSPKAGKRESRRFLGDVILTQTDLEAGRRFPDDIAYGGHDLDDHRPFGEVGNIYAFSIPPMYGIPYRACYSRNTPNLLLAGRLISATHLAHSSTRLMRTGGAIGQAVGYAAVLCCRCDCTPREVYERHLDELRRGLLEADATFLAVPLPALSVPATGTGASLGIPTLPSPVSGAGDLAGTTAFHLLPAPVSGACSPTNISASASSELRFNDLCLAHEAPDQLVPLTAPAGVVLWDWPSTLEGLELYLRNDSPEEQALTVDLYRARREPRWKSVDDYEAFGRNDLRDEAFRRLASLPLPVPAGHQGWLNVPLPEPLDLGDQDPASDDDRVLIAVSESPQVRWALADTKHLPEIAEMVEHSHHSPRWHPLGAMAALRLSPPPALGEASNVLDGYPRRFSRGPTHMWASDPAQGLPQDLTLSWPEPQMIDGVHLVFDNLAAARHEYPWENGTRVLPILVKAYELAVWDEGAWRMVAREEENYHRFCPHSFEAVRTDRVRLRVLATHGRTGQARVYQVRVLQRQALTG
jgi:hypothetical protein